MVCWFDWIIRLEIQQLNLKYFRHHNEKVEYEWEGGSPSVGQLFADGQLDSPYYTRPATYRGRRVPEVLLSGDHGSIARWRADMAREATRTKRPDLYKGSGS